MSPRAEHRPHGHGDEGFSLVEVVVAIGIVVTLMVAVLPQLISGIRANDVARVGSQGKTLAASELERLRNLPFQVQPNAGQYVDLFDRYFQDLTAPGAAPACKDGDRWVPPAKESTGYVSGSARCSYEPASGPFYRVVRRVGGYAAKGIAADPDLAGFVVVVNTQFLDAQTPPQPKSPVTGYDTKTVGKDQPASGQVGLTVTVLADRPSTTRPVTTYTQVSRSYQTTTRVRATSDSVAMEASTMLPGPSETEGNAVAVSSGLVNLDASLVAGSRVEVSAAGVTSSAATGENGGATRTALTAPPDSAPTWSSNSGGQLTAAGCELVCWGGGDRTSTWTPTTTDGLPGIGSPTTPLEVALKTPSTGEGYALRMGAGTGALFRPGLGLSNPLLRLRSADFGFGIGAGCSVTDSGNGLRIAGGGWARTTATGAQACSTARTAEIAVLPRGTGDNPLVKVKLAGAAARCEVDGTALTATAAFDLRLQYWNGSGYSPVGAGTFTASGDTALPDPSTLMVGGTPLSTWIESWSVARVSSGITKVAAGRTTRVSVPAVFNLVTVPLRHRVASDGTPVLDGSGNRVVDPLSTLSLTVGSVGCTAEDRR